MNDTTLLNASCRFALAALLHDLGKLAERTGVIFPDLAGNQATYCPLYNGRYSHLHAAYSGLAIDEIERHLPEIQQGNMAPFSSWGDRQRRDDSLINGAAMHHKPETPLQRIIATADRLASGFERSEFNDYYNRAQEEREEKAGIKGKKVNHVRARQWPLLETVQNTGEPIHRLPLRAMTPTTLFPVAQQGSSDQEARQEYAGLWKAFIGGLKEIPSDHRGVLPLWLDHFDSLYLTFTHAIPSATAMKKPGGGFMTIPADVSLYDHSKATAALAVALWRYHEAYGTVETAFSEGEWNRQQKWHDSEAAEFLLIQGDFFGIQDFIFAGGGETTKKASKLLRGKSFFVSLLTELAALKVLDAFDLPAVSQITNAAGKFLIVAPNLPNAENKVQMVREELDQWFLQYTFGQGGIGLATTAAQPGDFKKDKFQGLMQRLFEDLEKRKRRRFDLCGTDVSPVFPVLYSEDGVCAFCGKAPAVVEVVEKKKGCQLCYDQIRIGDQLVKKERLFISRNRVNDDTLGVTYFGYRVTFAASGAQQFGSLVSSGELLRVWDFSLPHKNGMVPLWNGYARRAINAYVPKEEDKIRDFEWIAGRSVREDPHTGKRHGVAALGILKGDVDDLGMIFQKGLKKPTFARMAALSRQVNAFFAVWLPWYCAREYPNTYTVFAGGDDFFLIGPWLEQIRLATSMRQAFTDYAGKNPAIHFSAGLAVIKPGIPVPALAEIAEDSLARAKEYKEMVEDTLANVKKYGDGKEKNAVTCWDRTVSWETFSEMLKAEQELANLMVLLKQEYQFEISTAYLYGLLYLCDKAESQRPEDAIWRSWFVYRTWRFVVDKLRNTKDDQTRQTIYREQFADTIGKRITIHKGNYKIALFTNFYQRREAS